MLDLHRAVEREVGEVVVQRPGDPPRVVHAVEEVGVDERHVAGALVDLLLDVGEHGVDIDDLDPSVVDDRHRAVPAAV